MAKQNEKTDSETPKTVDMPKINLIEFCDSQAVNEVDRNAVYMKYGKLTENTTEEWIKELESKITLRKTDK